METVLFLSFHETGESLGKAELETVGLAKAVQSQVGEAELVGGIVGRTADPAVEQLTSCGASRVFKIAGEEFAQAVYATDAAAAETICREAGATIVVCAGTSRVSRILPGVASRLNGRIDTHVCEISSEGPALQVTRWYYRQRMRAIMSRVQRPWFISFEPGSVSPWDGQSVSASAEVVELEKPEIKKRTRVEGFQEPTSGEQTIRPDAELLLVAGAGWTKKQADGEIKVKSAEGLILEFLDRMQASLGGSKSMVDLSSEGQEILSFMTHLNQIGQTGSSPRHSKGLATCCHGEEPHVVGWRFVNERRVINTDENCGWVQGKADVVYIEDAFAVMTRVNELLAQ